MLSDSARFVSSPFTFILFSPCYSPSCRGGCAAFFISPPALDGTHENESRLTGRQPEESRNVIKNFFFLFFFSFFFSKERCAILFWFYFLKHAMSKAARLACMEVVRRAPSDWLASSNSSSSAIAAAAAARGSIIVLPGSEKKKTKEEGRKDAFI